MSVIAVNVNEVREYSLLEDNGDNKTIFNLGQFDTFVRSYLSAKINKIQTDGGDINEWSYDVLRFGLKGWKNLKHADGTDVVFSTTKVKVPGTTEKEVVSDECIALLKYEWVEELSLDIYKNNWLSAEQKKTLNVL